MAGADRKRIAFLCSGGGGNLRFIHKAIEFGWIPEAGICEVLTDRECPANAFAATAGIPSRVVDFGGAGQQELLAALSGANPDLVVTTVHRILNEQVVDRFRGRLLNLHYSLLPAFGGAIGVRPLKSALEYGARVVGATAHEVDQTVDGGRPVVQAVVPVRSHDTAESLMDLVFRCGCLALASAVNVRLGRAAPEPEMAVAVKGRTCLVSAPICMPERVVASEDFWAELAAAPAEPRNPR